MYRVILYYVFTMYTTVHLRWTLAGSTNLRRTLAGSIVILIQTVILSERSPVLTRLTVTVPLFSLTLIFTALNSIVATLKKMQNALLIQAIKVSYNAIVRHPSIVVTVKCLMHYFAWILSTSTITIYC